MAETKGLEPGTLTFERVVRDCLRNKDIVGRGEKRGLLYDFKILHNGEHIGWWSAYTTNNGTDTAGYRYWLRDRTFETVCRPRPGKYERNIVAAHSQAEFESVLIANFHLLPTEKQLTERQAEREREEAKKVADKAEQERLYRLQQAGPEMASLLLRVLQAPAAPPLAEIGDVLRKAGAL